MIFPSLPARNLDREELKTLVHQLASDPEAWRDLVGYSDEQRVFVSLYRDDYVDIWLLCWTPENDTGWHDHDISAGAVRVVKGALTEANPRIGGQPAVRSVGAGEAFSFGPDHIHRLSGAREHSVSIHAYSPPLWRLGQYAIADDGVMRRHSISYADELRPVDAEVAA
jgi:hypothetical protein